MKKNNIAAISGLIALSAIKAWKKGGSASTLLPYSLCVKEYNERGWISQVESASEGEKNFVNRLTLEGTSENRIFLKHLKSIEILKIEDTLATEKVLDGLGELKELKSLSLKHHIRSENLTIDLSDLNQLEHLESLSIEVYPNEEYKDAKIIFPNDLSSLKKLTDVWISIPARENVSLDFIGTIENLMDLGIQNTTIGEGQGNLHIPDSVGYLQKLVYMRVVNVASLPKSISNLSKLKILHINGSGGMVNLKNHNAFNGLMLPQDIGAAPELRKIFISNSYIKGVPESIGKSQVLDTFKITHGWVDRLPKSLGNIDTSVVELYLWMDRKVKYPSVEIATAWMCDGFNPYVYAKIEKFLPTEQRDLRRF